MSRPRSSGDVFGLAFLDVITCGFGAIVLLLLISKPSPVDIEDSTRAQAQHEEALAAATSIVTRLRAQWEALQAMLANEAQRPEATPDDDPALEETIRTANQRLAQLKRDNEGLEQVKTSLERATVRVRSPVEERDIEVGGIPVDSEYVIFIVDTSGSMQAIWSRIVDVMNNVLDIHPKVLGFQVMNDNGSYLISAYKKKWIPDTPRRRASIMKAFRGWQAFSNSSPVEGLETALRTYARQKEKIAIYIFGDDYTGSSYDQVIETLRRLNTDRVTGKRKVRVHAIGFYSEHSTDRYATLMREVTRNNGGAFLALPIEDARGNPGVARPVYKPGALRQ